MGVALAVDATEGLVGRAAHIGVGAADCTSRSVGVCTDIRTDMDMDMCTDMVHSRPAYLEQHKMDFGRHIAVQQSAQL